MSERRPPGVSIESWVERQIREATERGEFDNLPGAGKRLAWLDEPDEELRWVKRYVEREGLPVDALLPLSLRLLREIERLPDTVRRLPSEAAVRDVVGDLNRRIREWIRTPSGPRVRITPVNAESVLEEWRAGRVYKGGRRAGKTSFTAAPAAASATTGGRSDVPAPVRRRWLGRWWRRVARR